MFKKWITRRTLTITTITILALLFIYFILPISIPLIGALLLALMIEPLIRRLELKFNSRKWSVTAIYSLIIGVLLLFSYFFMTKLIENIIQFATDLPGKMNGLIKAWDKIEERINMVLPDSVTTTINDEVQNFLLSMRDGIVNYFNVENITLFIASLPELLISSLVFLVALFLFMLEIPKIKLFFRNHMYDRTYEKSLFVWQRISGSIFGMIRAAFILSFITWVFTFIGLLFITPENAMIMSLIICVVDLLPILGATGITIPWALYEYITGDHIMALKLILLSLFLLVQRKVLEPKIMGNGVGLSPLPTLIAMYIGLKLMGFIGFFVGPIVLILILTLVESGAIKTNFKI